MGRICAFLNLVIRFFLYVNHPLGFQDVLTILWMMISLIFSLRVNGCFFHVFFFFSFPFSSFPNEPQIMLFVLSLSLSLYSMASGLIRKWDLGTLNDKG